MDYSGSTTSASVKGLSSPKATKIRPKSKSKTKKGKK